MGRGPGTKTGQTVSLDGRSTRRGYGKGRRGRGKGRTVRIPTRLVPSHRVRGVGPPHRGCPTERVPALVVLPLLKLPGRPSTLTTATVHIVLHPPHLTVDLVSWRPGVGSVARSQGRRGCPTGPVDTRRRHGWGRDVRGPVARPLDDGSDVSIPADIGMGNEVGEPGHRETGGVEGGESVEKRVEGRGC